MPLTVAERVERPTQDVLAVNLERQVVGAADGEHAEVAVKHEQGFAHRVHDGARIGLVTPLRDGMNLVAKEYVAAQALDNPGVLVLSQFAGAAQELKSALIVNPYDIEATASAIARAVAMPLEERKDRWSAMMTVLRANSIHDWTAHFLQALSNEHEGMDRRPSDRGRLLLYLENNRNDVPIPTQPP